MYIVGDRKFKRLAAALEYANKEFARSGIVLSVEKVANYA
jgi:hypothetical protein